MCVPILNRFYALQTVENCVCILRNLSYRLENEILPQLASEVVDEEWERAQAQERTQYEAEKKKKGKSSTGCFGSSNQKAFHVWPHILRVSLCER